MAAISLLYTFLVGFCYSYYPTSAFGIFSSPLQGAMVSHSGPWDEHSDSEVEEPAAGRDKRAISRWNYYGWGGYSSGSLVASVCAPPLNLSSL
jgi:hypothetical protein